MYKQLVLLTWFVLSGSVQAATGTYTLPGGETLQDPTRPADWQVVTSVATGKPVAHFKLNYILSSSERSQAMINGQRVGEGDLINGARVLRIAADSVTLNVDGQKRILQTKTSKSIKK